VKKVTLGFMVIVIVLSSFPLPHEDTKAVQTNKWSLWSGGTRLRGANIYQRRVYLELDGPDFLGPGPVGPPYTQDDFNKLASFGANYVNISHPGLFTEKPPYKLDQNIQANLDKLLGMIAKARMFAVIGFRTGPGRSEFTFFRDGAGDWFDPSYLNESVWQDQAAQDAWIEMWRYTAERYKTSPIVVGYDLMVEPNANHVLESWDPDEFYAAYSDTLYDWNQLHPGITAAIREVDSMTPILIGGMSYSSIYWLPYVKLTGDARTVYTVHHYEPFEYTHQDPDRNGRLRLVYPGTFDADGDGRSESVNRTWLQNFLSTVDQFAAKNKVPMAVNEFGVKRWEPGAWRYMDDQMSLFEARRMNYALWLWESSWKPLAEEDAFNFRHGPNPRTHSDVLFSSLQTVISNYWRRNTMRP
jgi:hypothetical protein